MKSWLCNNCDLKFDSELSTVCVQCGDTDISSLPEISKESLSEAHAEAKTEMSGIDYEPIKDILRKLCMEAYETSFDSIEWGKAINITVEKLKPYFKVI